MQRDSLGLGRCLERYRTGSPRVHSVLSDMRLTVLLTMAMLIASPARARQQPTRPEASPTEQGRPRTNQRRTQDGPVEGSTPAAEVPPVSIARVRAALEKPPPILTPPDRAADFSVHIEERVPLQEIFDTPPWATPPEGGWGPFGWGGTPSSVLVSVDVLPLLKAAKRAYSEHAAREEVKRAIADYCAAQPNAGAAIQICSPAR
jgi:hypothetical protein